LPQCACGLKQAPPSIRPKKYVGQTFAASFAHDSEFLWEMIGLIDNHAARPGALDLRRTKREFVKASIRNAYQLGYADKSRIPYKQLGLAANAAKGHAEHVIPVALLAVIVLLYSHKEDFKARLLRAKLAPVALISDASHRDLFDFRVNMRVPKKSKERKAQAKAAKCVGTPFLRYEAVKPSGSRIDTVDHLGGRICNRCWSVETYFRHLEEEDAGQSELGKLLRQYRPDDPGFLQIDWETVLIPSPNDRHGWAQSRKPMDMMAHGWSTSLFQA
jgi:hypothetical protein